MKSSDSFGKIRHLAINIIPDKYGELIVERLEIELYLLKKKFIFDNFCSCFFFQYFIDPQREDSKLSFRAENFIKI